MPVIHSRHPEAGTVCIDEAACTRCGECASVCPTEVLRQEDGHIAVHPESHFGCIACGHCLMVCPGDAVTVTGRGLSPADLLPLPPPEARSSAPALEALMRARRSVRSFQDRELEPETLDRILEAAASAPMGIPPWDVGVVVVRGRERVAALAARIVEGYAGLLKMMKPWVLALMRPFMPKTRYEAFQSFILPLARSYVEARAHGQDRLFYGAPAVLIFHHSPYAEATDAAIACTYAMLAAEALGLGTTMIGAAAPVLMRNPKLCRRLGIPEGNKPAICLIVGHPAVHFRKAVRRRFL